MVQTLRFELSEEEWANLEEYINKLIRTHDLRRYGIVILIPPPSFRNSMKFFVVPDKIFVRYL